MRLRILITVAIVVGLASVLPACGQAQADAERVRAFIEEVRYAEAEALARAWLAEVEEEYGEDSEQTAKTLDLLVETIWRGGRGRVVEDALALAERAVAIKQTIHGTDHPATATSLDNLASVLAFRGRHEEANELFLRALRVREQVLGPEHPAVADTLEHLAHLRYHTDVPGSCVEACRRALDIREKSLPPGHQDSASTLHFLTWLLVGQVPPETLAPLVDGAFAAQERTGDRENPALAYALHTRAYLCGRRKDYEQARELHQRAVDLREKRLGPDHPDLADSLRILAINLGKLGRHDEARAASERAIEIAERTRGPEYCALSTWRSNLAKDLRKLGRDEEARDALERALAVSEKCYGGESSRSAAHWESIGDILRDLQRYNEAGAAYERAVQIRTALGGGESKQVASLLADLAWTLKNRERYEDAVAQYERALAIREKVYGREHEEVASALNGVGIMLTYAGREEEALPYYDEAARIWEQRNGENHPNVAVAESNAGWALRLLGRYDEARHHYERARSILESARGPADPGVPSALRNLGRCAAGLGDRDRAVAYYEQALRIYTDLRGEDDPEVATTLREMGWELLFAGDYVEARESLERAVRILEANHGRVHQEVAWALNGLGVVLAHLGDYEEALACKEEVLRIDEEIAGPDSMATSVALNNLGLFLVLRRGRPDRAKPLLERAVAIAEKLPGGEDPILAISQISLARAATDLGDYARAEESARRAVDVGTRLKLSPVYVGEAHHSLARTLAGTGRVEEARAAYARGLALYERGYGPHHPYVARALTDLARLEWNEGRKEALSLAVRASRILDDHTRVTLSTLPERQALRLVQTRDRPEEILFEGVLRRSGERSEWIEATWDWSLRRRGLVLEELAARRRDVLASEAPEAREAWERLVDARARLASIWVRGPGVETGEDPEAYRSALDRAIREKEEAEEELATLSSTYREGRKLAQVGLEEVRRSLPPDAALVEYVRAPVREPGSDETRMRDLALVVPAGGAEPVHVDLGPSGTLDALARAWRDELRSGFEALVASSADPAPAHLPDSAGRRLREVVWDPVVAKLGEARTVFVVPDGPLHQIHLAALPSKGDGYLVEEDRTLHLLSTSRDLVRLQRRASDEPAGRGLLALGAPDYDAGSALRMAGLTTGSAATSGYRGQLTACPLLGDAEWTPLPASRLEASDVGSLFEEREHPVTVLVGTAASEERFKREAPGKRVLHLATHGFFLQEGCASALTVGRGIGGLAPAAAPPEAEGGSGDGSVASTSTSFDLVGENPLLLSGLALAGANRHGEDSDNAEDGILTAEEIAALDLRGVEIAALSACDTGLGAVEVGEGVFGLRRALEIAGVRTVLMSLWPVPDEAARSWMTSFYETKLGGASVIEAGRRASVRTLHKLREDGQPTHPYLWAGFVAAGDWR